MPPEDTGWTLNTGLRGIENVHYSFTCIDESACREEKNMRVEVKTEATTVQGVEVGEAFYKEGRHYIRTDELVASGSIGVVCLEDGCLKYMNCIDEVKRVRGTFTIDW